MLELGAMEVSHIVAFGIFSLVRSVWSGLVEWREERRRREKKRLVQEAQWRAEEKRRREQELLERELAKKQEQELALNYRAWRNASNNELTRKAVERRQQLDEWDFKD